MTFTVTCRGADGALREETVEAASRAECFAKMKARGIVPVSVREGARNGGRKNAASPKMATQGGAGRAANVSAAPRGGTWRAAVLAAALLAAAGGAWWWLAAREDARPPEPKAVKAVKDVKAVKNVKVVKDIEAPKVTTNAPPTKEEKRAAQLKAIRDKYGDNVPDNLKPVVYFLENPPQRTFHPARTKASIFKRRSEREIASMVMTEPGTWFMRKPTFNERFDEDFRASLDERIEFAEDDTDEDKALKQAVIDTKAELAERMKAGETPSAAMNAFADSMYELGQYRRLLQDELGKIKRDAQYSNQDVEDFVNAANKMLKDKGAQPIPMPKMVFRQVSLKKAAARAEEKARKAQEEKK